MDDDSDRRFEILWGLYQENRAASRHHEDQRTATASMLVAVCAAVIAVVTLDRVVSWSDLPLTLLLTAIGAFGVALSLKQYERCQLHRLRAKRILERIDETFGETGASALLSVIDQEHVHETRALWCQPLHRWWTGLYALLLAFGVMLTLLAFWHR